MKFLLFSDLHHAPTRFMAGTDRHLDAILSRAEQAEVDFIIHAGDFCHGADREETRRFIERYNNFHIPTYHVLGNHDCDHTPREEMLERYRMPGEYYCFDFGGYRIIALNPNYLYMNGEYIPYDMGQYLKLGAYRDFVPPEQLAWLKETVEGSPYPCIFISHESFERPDGVRNRSEVLDIINEANARRPHSVLMCINGHHHRDFVRILDGVCFFEINAVTFDWLNNPHEFYDPEMRAQYKYLKHSLTWNDPLCAVVTVEGTTVTIEGAESSFLDGVTREMTGNEPFDAAGRPATPRIGYAKFTLH